MSCVRALHGRAVQKHVTPTRLIFDHNLSPKLPSLLGELFPHSMQVTDLDLDAVDDKVIWDFAIHNGYDIATKDKDYEDLSELFGHPPKVIRITLGNSPTSTVEDLFHLSQPEIEAF